MKRRVVVCLRDTRGEIAYGKGDGFYTKGMMQMQTKGTSDD